MIQTSVEVNNLQVTSKTEINSGQGSSVKNISPSILNYYLETQLSRLYFRLKESGSIVRETA